MGLASFRALQNDCVRACVRVILDGVVCSESCLILLCTYTYSQSKALLACCWAVVSQAVVSPFACAQIGIH